MTDQQTCREAFERECTIMNLPIGRGLDYDNKKTRLCWIFWQAAWNARPAPQVTDAMLLDALNKWFGFTEPHTTINTFFPSDVSNMRAALEAALKVEG